MKRKQFSPEQISRILKDHEQGKSVEEIVREYGVSQASFYKWRSCYGCMDALWVKMIKIFGRWKSQTQDDLCLYSFGFKDRQGVYRKNL